MERCFVIQPFDKDRFDKRFVDTFKPAIKNAGLDAYRIDEDLSVRIPIEDIELGISNSVICFADITLDNPNVWYELGFALACGKDVVMVCSDERTGDFPFDIRHRQVIRYKTQSSSDFKILEEAITSKIKALLKQTKTANSLHALQTPSHDGIAGHEIALMLLIAEHQFTSDESISVYFLKTGMQQAQFNGFATGVAIKTLERKNMIKTSQESDYQSQGELYMVCRLTDEGESWVLANADKYITQPDVELRKIIDHPI